MAVIVAISRDTMPSQDDHAAADRRKRGIRINEVGDGRVNKTEETTQERSPTRTGFARRLLKLAVEADSSRFVGGRMASLALLLAILAAFALAGYGIAAALARYW